MSMCLALENKRKYYACKRRGAKKERKKISRGDNGNSNSIQEYFALVITSAVVTTNRLTIMRHFKWKSYCEITVNCVLRHNVIVINSTERGLCFGTFRISTSCHIIIISRRCLTYSWAPAVQSSFLAVAFFHSLFAVPFFFYIIFLRSFKCNFSCYFRENEKFIAPRAAVKKSGGTENSTPDIKMSKNWMAWWCWILQEKHKH